MCPRASRASAGPQRVQILSAEQRRAQPRSRSATFQKTAATDKERAGWELRRDESGRLDRHIPFWKMLGGEGRKKEVSSQRRKRRRRRVV